MKTIVAAVLLLGSVSAASAQYYGYGSGSNSSSHYTSGYTNSHGNYVEPHYQTNPNHTQYDNYNTSGNYNPHSGSYGTRSPRY